MLRFIHAADLHLDSPLKGLESYEGAPVDEIRGATRRALENLVDLAIERSVHFVLIAGDVYDGDWKDHNTGLFFVRHMYRLREAGIPVVLISGNHDAASKITRTLNLPDNVELLAHGQATTADSPMLYDRGVAVHGQSFAKMSEYGNLAEGYPRRREGMFNIGLLHTSMDGAEGHAPYAPCTLEHLRQKAYDYWALGHVHRRQVRCEDPLVIFPGNVQGRHIREAGAKGCYVVTADSHGKCECEFVPLDVFRWEVSVVDASDLHRVDDVLEQFNAQLHALSRLHDGLPLAVRVEVTGSTKLHGVLRADPLRWTNEFRSVALANPSDRIWVEKVKWHTAPQSRPMGDVDPSSPLGTLHECLDELRRDEQQLTALAHALDDLRRKLPEELAREDDPMHLNDPAQLRQWLDEVEQMLMDRLRAGAAEGAQE